MKLDEFNYPIDQSLIAKAPLLNRTDSRCLSLHKTSGELCHGQMKDFGFNLQKGDVLVLNDTKVIKARLFATKETGGKVEIFIERILDEKNASALVRSNKPIAVGALLTIAPGVTVTVVDKTPPLVRVSLESDLAWMGVLMKYGHIPLPPYIDRADNEDDITRYQSVFAKHDGSVAAPTASLHFDEDLLAVCRAKGVEIVSVTLHVGLGTFMPVKTQNIEDHVMHKEVFSIDEKTCEAINSAKKDHRRVIAVGTTAVRVLESVSQNGLLAATRGETNIFITPGFNFEIVDCLLTNFHLPKSTLLMLVSAFSKKDYIMKAYQDAIDKSYRFFSYGDAMFIHN